MYSLLDYAKLCNAAYNGKKVNDHSFEVDVRVGMIVIAIAGTKNFKNLLHDASIWPSLTPTNCLAHAGVVGAYQELFSEIEPYTKTKLPFCFTGHSLGGGIAQIFAEKFGVKVITFGSLKTYFRFYNPRLNHFRVVCDDDPVPLMPGCIAYSHKESALSLVDSDKGWDFEDHPINNYIARIQQRGEIIC